jgi:glycosyltransferase involved in cell wall biosynthesis
MRIIQVVTQLEAGGAQRAAVLLSDGLSARGHTVETWFFYRKRDAFRGATNLRLMFEDRPAVLATLQLPFRLTSRLREFGADAVIAHTHYANVIALPAAAAAGVPVRIAVQQNPVDSYPFLARHLDRILGRGKTYSDIVSVSHSVADSASRYATAYRAKMTVIHNAVSSPEGLRGDRAELARFGIPPAVPFLVNVGRLHYQKNQATLIRALTNVPAAHLVMIGEGELRGELVGLAAKLRLRERVHFMGELPWDDAIRISRHACAFVFPSLFEGMSLALVEAMSLGLPIVGSDIPSIREAIADGGLLTPPTDVQGLASSINRVVDDEALAARMRTRSLERAQMFSLAGMTDAYESLIRARIGRSGGPFPDAAASRPPGSAG